MELDRKERLDLLRELGLSTYSPSHFRFDGFGVQVFQEALKTWDVQITPLHSHKDRAALVDFEQESALICHRDYKEDWTCLRKVAGEWYEFNCLYPAPELVPDFYMPTYIDILEGSGWTVYLVKGKLSEKHDAPAAQACSDDGPRSPHEDDAEGIGTANARNAMPA